MSDTDEEEVAKLRPVRRPAWIALLLNATLLTSALGIPYVRGRWRAEEAAARYAELAACMYGGEVVDPSPGLAMPSGDREHFAARVERAPSTWPGDCAAILEVMKPEPVIFLMPAPKQAEEDLRRAIDQASGEIDALADARTDARESGVGLGAVPERPLRALEQLRAALANALQAADVTVDPTAPAITLGEDETIVRPSRIPLRIAAGGTTIVRPEPGGLRVVASDGQRVSEVVAREGSVFEILVPRSSSMRGIALAPEGGRLLWITSEATCESDPARCSMRLLGVAPIEEVREPVVRWWLAAHPASRLDRSVRFETAAVSVIARAPGGEGAELRRFALDPATPPPVEGAEVVPIEAIDPEALGSPIDALLVDGGALRVERDRSMDGPSTAGASLRIAGPAIGSGGHGALASGQGVADDAITIPLPLDAAARAEALLASPPRVPRAGEALLARCGGWTALALREGIAVIPPRPAPGPHVLLQDLREPVLGASPSDDAMVLACTEHGADVIALDREDRVLRWACTPERCGDLQIVARGARSIAAAHAAGTTLVAWSGDVAHPQIRVARVRREVIGGPEVPGPCWVGVGGEPAGGMCGAPFVVADGDRLLVAAREQADLLVLELAEIGFRRLPGL